MNQPDSALTFDPAQHGLYRRVLAKDGYHIDDAGWKRARAEGAFVGTCRHCGGYLKAQPTPPEHHRNPDGPSFAEAECVSCGHQFAAPMGKVLRRSGINSQQPGQWRAGRHKAITAGPTV